MSERVLVTGTTGFIGSAVLRALVERGETDLIALVRTPEAEASLPRGVLGVRGDLRFPESLRGICDGTDAVVHCAAYVGSDPGLCETINRTGTGYLLAEALRAGVSRTVCLSTASVYGSGPHRGLRESGAVPAPVSVTSESRLAAETAVREAGGMAVRPHLVHGRGDRWVVPALAVLFRVIPGWVDGGAARTSMIHVDALGRAIAVLAARPDTWRPGAVYHAAHPEAPSMRTLADSLARHLGVVVPSGGVSRAAALEQVRAAGLRERHLEMLTVDHWYDSAALWDATGCAPGPRFDAALGADSAWYANHLGGGRG
ncbi:NAD-dependent epimerase/dehydratase family protein [Streptomyces beijiangensis]|uniref:NAD(P)-dependent oxidoreductase n=1 Tax=Streptomyces beijiangensis TaxID=163361 RepID=A0A939JLA7_9ACTN|nr:NAD(P)-dependent oxidoreductase [Streptomyces beijiangensis]MBO0516200.1 NAD(P)-dependent oxidoreductase [Streptomyces beijiangensis]